MGEHGREELLPPVRGESDVVSGTDAHEDGLGSSGAKDELPNGADAVEQFFPLDKFHDCLKTEVGEAAARQKSCRSTKDCPFIPARKFD